MNGAQLAEVLATRLGISRAASRAYLETLTDEVASALARDERVVLRGFGALEPQWHAARSVRHPGTGEPALVPAGRTVVFRPGRPLRAVLNHGFNNPGESAPE
jgi:nucleoid DNA-binding protein